MVRVPKSNSLIQNGALQVSKGMSAAELRWRQLGLDFHGDFEWWLNVPIPRKSDTL